MRELLPAVVAWTLSPGEQDDTDLHLLAINIKAMGNRARFFDMMLRFTLGLKHSIKHGDERIYTDLATDHPIDLTRYQVANCYMGRCGLINSGGASGTNDLQQAVKAYGVELEPVPRTVAARPAADVGFVAHLRREQAEPARVGLALQPGALRVLAVQELF